jgi:hypothetical protein
MPGEHCESKKALLAFALARGESVSDWAGANQVPLSTAYRWAKDPELRSLVWKVRRRCLDEAVGILASNVATAAARIVKLGETSANESVQLRASRAVLSDTIAVSKFTTLEERLAHVEEQLDDRARAGGRGEAR